MKEFLWIRFLFLIFAIQKFKYNGRKVSNGTIDEVVRTQ